MLSIIIISIIKFYVFLQKLFLPNAIDISFLLWKITSPSYEYFDLCNSSGSKTLHVLLQCTAAQKWSAYSRARKSNISLPNAISCQGPQIHNLISSGTLISLLASPPSTASFYSLSASLSCIAPSILAIFISSTIWLIFIFVCLLFFFLCSFVFFFHSCQLLHVAKILPSSFSPPYGSLFGHCWSVHISRVQWVNITFLGSYAKNMVFGGTKYCSLRILCVNFHICWNVAWVNNLTNIMSEFSQEILIKIRKLQGFHI